MNRGYARYYQQFEPAWANKLVLEQDDIRAGVLTMIQTNKSGAVHLALPAMKISLVRITDEAIAHALRESHN